jgi:iron complex outermembrane recepter protein
MNWKINLAVKSALGLSLVAPLAYGQSAPTAPVADTTAPLEEVVVTGIRFSLEQSLEKKHAATTLVEVVTAEDIGKMPDKNIADSLQRVPGMTLSSAGATEGGFDENDRVSMRGTNPSLTQTLVDGHNVAAGDWFVLDQTNTVGRSVSYTLLPSELVSQIVVHKSTESSLVEGGVAGTVDIITRKPLDIDKPFSVEASLGAVYADLPSKTDPQFSALANWHNDDRTFGVMVQGFSEERHLERQGVELLGYDTIGPCSQVVTGIPGSGPLPGGGCSTGAVTLTPHPDLSGVQYPTDIGAAFFTQDRKRTGGLVNVEWKPNDALNFDLSGFTSLLKAPNYNRNYLLWDTSFIGSGNGQAPDAGYVVTNNTLVNANFTGVPGTAYGIYDEISRPDESESSNFINLDGNLKVNDALSFFGQVGTSQGTGKTPTQDVAETEFDVGNGAGYSLNGISTGPSFNFANTNNSTPFPGPVTAGNPTGGVPFGWIFGAQNVDVVDKENWGKIDGTYLANNNAWTDLKFGVRLEDHSRNSTNVLAQGPLGPAEAGGAAYPTTWSNYPLNFDQFGGSIPTGMWYWTPAQLAAYDNPANVNRNPITRAYIDDGWFGITEHTDAAYVEANFKGSNWSGDVGVRYVRTVEDATVWAQDSSVTATTPGAVTTSAFGPYVARPVDHTYDDILPSANLKIDLDKDLVARFSVGQTMTRADYSALAGDTSLGQPPSCAAVCTAGNGTTGNPDLKPIKSTNVDAGIEWYFAKQSLLSATLFYMDLQNYIGYGTVPLTSFTFSTQFPTGQNLDYLLTAPINTSGRVEGAEFNYQQAFTDHWGMAANLSLTDGKQTSDVVNGDDRLVGTSKEVYNINGYYENSHFSGRVAWNYRSSFYDGLDRSTAFSMAGVGYLTASLAYIINDNFSVTLDGQNLNNPTLKYYALDTTQPRAFYTNGRQYYLNLRVKF